MPRTRPPRLPLREAARLFRLLADPGRLHLLLLLAERGEGFGGAPAGALAEAAGRSEATTGHHLKRLRLAGVVTCRREGRRASDRLNSPFAAALLRRVRAA